MFLMSTKPEVVLSEVDPFIKSVKLSEIYRNTNDTIRMKKCKERGTVREVGSRE